ncbi:DUF3265 domain-containing protein [Vibrio parahaemolyticus]|nr:DUF3265 domain-containing protein [Vibrio parahaemolyticus]MDK9428937.1 DUF3265 domain-containing protein [Vibrio parahaemolyticus]MDK9438029.1 DUF3265 domain-containing protein [Vibrio parahaemolyticus]
MTKVVCGNIGIALLTP